MIRPLLCLLMASAPIATPDLKLQFTIPQKQEDSPLSEAWDYYRSDAFLLCASRLDRYLTDAKRHALALPKPTRAAIAIIYEQCAVGVDESGASESALGIIRSALRLAPKSYSIHFHHGKILRHAGYQEEAKASFTRAIALAQESNRLSGEIEGNALEQEEPEIVRDAAREALQE